MTNSGHMKRIKHEDIETLAYERFPIIPLQTETGEGEKLEIAEKDWDNFILSIRSIAMNNGYREGIKYVCNKFNLWDLNELADCEGVNEAAEGYRDNSEDKTDKIKEAFLAGVAWYAGRFKHTEGTIKDVQYRATVECNEFTHLLNLRDKDNVEVLIRKINGRNK